jgi:hypothetical protein
VKESESPFENLYQEEIYSIPSKILIVLSKSWNELKEDDKALLIKILGSVKLSIASVVIATIPHFSEESLEPYSPSRIIAFGATSAENQKQYELIRMGDVPLIQAHDLHLLDDARKKSLWLALKQMFSL